MAEETKNAEDKGSCGPCGHKCCGCAKVLMGILIGIVLSVGACWLHGKCGRHMCPISGSSTAPTAPAAPAKN